MQIVKVRSYRGILYYLYAEKNINYFATFMEVTNFARLS
jgi:hypothetical protein